MKKLNNKKGFTLVEMIVVIAIIAALAAILIPTMTGYVTRAHVANLNSTAGKIRDNVTYFMTQAGSDGYGMFRSREAVCDVTVSIHDYEWTVMTSTQAVFLSQYSTYWTSSGRSYLDAVVDTDNAEERLANYLAETFREIKSGFCKFRLVGGMCYALYFTDQQETEVTVMPAFGAYTDWVLDDFEWNGGVEGVTQDGIIVGTSPLIK